MGWRVEHEPAVRGTLLEAAGKASLHVVEPLPLALEVLRRISIARAHEQLGLCLPPRRATVPT